MGSMMKGFVPEAFVMMSGSSRSASPWRSACDLSKLSRSFLAALPSAESLPAAAILARNEARCVSAASCWPGAVYTNSSHHEHAMAHPCQHPSHLAGGALLLATMAVP
jgi:hypothetical protein